MRKFLWDTLIGGIFVVVPVSFILLQLKKVLGAFRSALAPIAQHLPFEAALPGLWALILVALACLLAGLIVRTGPGKRITRGADRKIASILPIWGVIRGIGNVLTREGESQVKPAMIRTGDGYFLGFLVEEISGGLCSVFMPEPPNPTAGPLMIVERESVQLLDVAPMRIARCIANWGLGAGELMKHARTRP